MRASDHEISFEMRRSYQTCDTVTSNDDYDDDARAHAMHDELACIASIAMSELS